MALKPITVSQLNKYLNHIIYTDYLLSSLAVCGEVTAVKFHENGKVYFTISDGGSKNKLNCHMLLSYTQHLPKDLEIGDKVILTGSLQLLGYFGSYALNVNSIEIEGAGDRLLELNRIKDKLYKEGLFDTEAKKPLPFFPKTIGIITSQSGAALSDMLKIIKGKNNYVDVKVFPSLVQGDKARESLINALNFAVENYGNILDVIIIGRGGGAPEDLDCFNDEGLARAIFNCPVPIISAVGHEIDYSISDFVADKRAETPTAAADMVAPDIEVIENFLENAKAKILNSLVKKVEREEIVLENKLNSINNAFERHLRAYESRIEQGRIILEENNPKKVLTKGYAILDTLDGEQISSTKMLRAGEDYRITFVDGGARVKVISIDEGVEDYER